MLVALFVIADVRRLRSLAERLFSHGAIQFVCIFEQCYRLPGVATRHAIQHVAHTWREFNTCAHEYIGHLFLAKSIEHKDAQAREECGNDLKRRVLGRGTNERHGTSLDKR